MGDIDECILAQTFVGQPVGAEVQHLKLYFALKNSWLETLDEVTTEVKLLKGKWELQGDRGKTVVGEAESAKAA